MLLFTITLNKHPIGFFLFHRLCLRLFFLSLYFFIFFLGLTRNLFVHVTLQFIHVPSWRIFKDKDSIYHEA